MWPDELHYNSKAAYAQSPSLGLSMLTFVLTFLTAVSTIVGGSLAVRERRRVHLLLGFGAGVLLGAIFLDLLPEALEIAEQHDWSSRRVLGLVVVGFLFFYLAERFLVKHVCHTGDCEREPRRLIGRMSAVGIIGHSAIDGASIAAAALVSWRTGLIVALGITTHDLGDGLNTVNALAKPNTLFSSPTHLPQFWVERWYSLCAFRQKAWHCSLDSPLDSSCLPPLVTCCRKRTAVLRVSPYRSPLLAE
jgi:hypothetical protein